MNRQKPRAGPGPCGRSLTWRSSIYLPADSWPSETLSRPSLGPSSSLNLVLALVLSAHPLLEALLSWRWRRGGGRTRCLKKVKKLRNPSKPRSSSKGSCNLPESGASLGQLVRAVSVDDVLDRGEGGKGGRPRIAARHRKNLKPESKRQLGQRGLISDTYQTLPSSAPPPPLPPRHCERRAAPSMCCRVIPGEGD